MGGGYVCFLLTSSFPSPPSSFFLVVKSVSLGVVPSSLWLKFLHRGLFGVFEWQGGGQLVVK